VRVERPARSVQVRGDPDGLRRLVTNLVDNAVRHAGSGVTVEVTRDAAGRPDGRWARVTVADDGPGIPAADREPVFARLARRDDARGRDGGGPGLGLPIARALARAHGGTPPLEDASPGLRAVLRLPLPGVTAGGRGQNPQFGYYTSRSECGDPSPP